MNPLAGYALAAVGVAAVCATYLLGGPNWLVFLFILLAGIGVVGADPDRPAGASRPHS